MDTKVCTKCNKEFPATTEFFYARASGRLIASCKACTNKKCRQYYKANREKILEQKSSRYCEANRDAIRIVNYRYYKANREKILEYGLRYRETNREKINARSKQYREANPEKIRERRRRYWLANRDRLLEQGKRYQQANLEKFREANRRWRQADPERAREQARKRYYRWKECHPEGTAVRNRLRRARRIGASGTHAAKDIARLYDGQNGKCWWCQCELNGSYHIDHRIPLSRDGSNAPENLVLTCPYCNLSKNNKLPSEWAGRLL